MTFTDEQARERYFAALRDEASFRDPSEAVGRALLTLEAERDDLKHSRDFNHEAAKAALDQRDAARREVQTYIEDARRCVARYTAVERELEALREMLSATLADWDKLGYGDESPFATENWSNAHVWGAVARGNCDAIKKALRPADAAGGMEGV